MHVVKVMPSSSLLTRTKQKAILRVNPRMQNEIFAIKIYSVPSCIICRNNYEKLLETLSSTFASEEGKLSSLYSKS